MELFSPDKFRVTTPGELRRLEVLTRRRITSDLSGEFRSTFRGTGLTFSDLREYVPGDDVKHINWRASARTGKTYIKSYEEDRSLRIHCALDISRSLNAGSKIPPVQLGLEFIALISTLAVQNRDSISVSLFADDIVEFIPNNHSRHHLHSILRTLTQPRVLPSTTNIAHSLYSLSRRLRQKTICFLISDFISDSFEDTLRLLTQKHDVISVYLDPLGDIPSCGIIQFQDAEHGSLIELDTSSPAVRAAIEKKRIETREAKKIALTNAGATFLPFTSSPVQTLHSLSKMRAQQWR